MCKVTRCPKIRTFLRWLGLWPSAECHYNHSYITSTLSHKWTPSCAKIKTPAELEADRIPSLQPRLRRHRSASKLSLATPFALVAAPRKQYPVSDTIHMDNAFSGVEVKDCTFADLGAGGGIPYAPRRSSSSQSRSLDRASSFSRSLPACAADDARNTTGRRSSQALAARNAFLVKVGLNFWSPALGSKYAWRVASTATTSGTPDVSASWCNETRCCTCLQRLYRVDALAQRGEVCECTS